MLSAQIFTNADEAHVTQVLSRMGLEDCFHGVICFETLNPPSELVESMDAPEMENGDMSLKTQILCKPSVEAMEAAIRIANVDPKKTVNTKTYNFFYLTENKACD